MGHGALVIGNWIEGSWGWGMGHGALVIGNWVFERAIGEQDAPTTIVL